MTALKKPNKWIHLASPFDDSNNECYIENITCVNAHEFIISSGDDSWKSDKQIFKYNIDTNMFNELCIDDNNWYCGNMDFNNKEQILYIENNNINEIISVDMKTNNSTSLLGAGYGIYFLFINNCFHMINMHDNHWIGAIQNKSLIAVHNCIDDEMDILLNGKAIYIPSKQCILLIGGYYDGGVSLSNELWIYKLTTEKWIKINNIGCVFGRYDFEAVLTSNEKYIVLFGGLKYNKDTDNDYETDDIFVLDIKDDNNWKMKQCAIKCPFGGKCIGTRTGGIDSKNDILVIGFVKECFKLKEFNNLQLPPQYIVALIGKWYSAEMIHWLQYGDHYGMYLNRILSSLY